LRPGQIRDSNGPMLAAAVAASGGRVVSMARVGDRERATYEAIAEAAATADLVLTSGGVSVGPHDLVRAAAAEAGFAPLLWRVRQKPGKPLFVAAREATLLVGLPGNPVSALSCFAHYVHPWLQAAAGRPFDWHRRRGRLAEPVAARDGRTHLVRVRLEADGVHPLARQASHMLTTISRAHGYLVVEPETALDAGSEVELFLYPWQATHNPRP
ncbi:MAG: molybdopterin molybdenumtransferase MoeA, partial [Nitrospirae bacterium]